jgi:hypothetical protein
MNILQTRIILAAAIILTSNIAQAEGLIYHEELFSNENYVQQVELSSFEITSQAIRHRKIDLTSNEILKTDDIFNYFSEVADVNHLLENNTNAVSSSPNSQDDQENRSVEFDFMNINV